MKEQISRESSWSVTQLKYHCILNLKFLPFIVPEKSLTKNSKLVYMERKKNDRIIEQISQESPSSLAFKNPGKPLTRNIPLGSMERKKNERTNKPRKPTVSYMI